MADYNINAITRRVVFTGSAGVGPYAFSFEVLDENDVAVYFNTTLLTLTTDYTVTVNANGTGSVTIVTGTNVPSTPTASDTIIIIGARDIERVTDFVTAGDLLASSLNEQLDALTIFDQQLAEEGQRSMRAPVYDPALVADGGTLDMTLPSASERAGKNLAFDANGNPEAGEDIGTFRGNWAASTTYYKRDIVKDASNDNIYRVNTEHTSSGTTPISGNADAAKFDLIIDAEAAYNYASDAEKLAINPEDSQFTLSDGVTTGYSALHHKEKALDAQTAAEAAQTAAETAQTAAETAETNAQTAQTAAETALDTFDDTYLGAKASAPTVDNDGDPLATGMLYTNSSSGTLFYYNGSAWVSVASGLTDVVNDTTPQLGGNLDVNGNSIVSISNGDIDITPNGTGNVSLGNFTFNADQTVGASEDNYVLTYDNTAGTIGLEAATGGGGGLTDVVDDTTPQLGGNLDLNSNNITGTGQINTSGDVTISTDNFTVVTGATPQVGIGTASPKRKLEVYGNNSTGAEISLTNTSMSTDRRTMNFFMTSDKAGWRMLNDAQTAGSPSVTLDWNGNLDATSFTGDGSGLTNVGTVLQFVSTELASGIQLQSSGAFHELTTSLRLSITPVSASSTLILKCYAPFVYPNSAQLSYAYFYNVTAGAPVSLASANPSRTAVAWHKRTRPFDINDMDIMDFMQLTPSGSTTARTYTIWHKTEGAVAQFLNSTLSSSAGTNTKIFFTITEVA